MTVAVKTDMGVGAKFARTWPKPSTEPRIGRKSERLTEPIPMRIERNAGAAGDQHMVLLGWNDSRWKQSSNKMHAVRRIGRSIERNEHANAGF